MSVAQAFEDYLAQSGPWGYVALFVVMALETAMILHFVPSELIVTVAAASLAHDAPSLLLVVAVATAGASAGSWMLYWAARAGGRPFLLRHQRLLHVDAAKLGRLEATFLKPTGDFLVFALRLLPFFRAAVSIPAGLARMDQRKFLLYSTWGAGVFNGVLAYVAYRLGQHGIGLHAVTEWTLHLVRANPPMTLLASLAVAAAAALGILAFRHRAELRRDGHLAGRAWRRLAVGVLLAGALLVVAALAAPQWVARGVYWFDREFIEDPLERPGFGTAILFAIEVLAVGLFLLALTPLVRNAAHAMRRRPR